MKKNSLKKLITPIVVVGSLLGCGTFTGENVTIGSYFNMCDAYECSGKMPFQKKEETKISFKNKDINVEIGMTAEGHKKLLVVPIYSNTPIPNEVIKKLVNPERNYTPHTAIKWIEKKAKENNLPLTINLKTGTPIKLNKKTLEALSKMDFLGDIRKLNEEFSKRIFPKIKEDYTKYNAIIFLHYNSEHIPFQFDSEVGKSKNFPQFIFSNFNILETNGFIINGESGSIPYGMGIAPETMAHEIMHLMGAQDKYGENKEKLCIIKEKEIEKDIMCNSKNSKLENLILGKTTTREIGWTDEDEDGIIGIYDTHPFNSNKN